MLARMMLEKIDKTFNGLDVDKKSSYPKAFLLGAAEGVIDTAVVAGLIMIAGGAKDIVIQTIKK